MGTRNATTLRIVTALALTLISSRAFAQDAATKKVPPTAKSEKVDISDLENKYWAPKDTDFSVVQNRTYSKEGRFFISPEWGVPVGDRWSQGSVTGVAANYFWSERFGVQAQYIKGNLSNNEPARFLASNYGSGVQPDHNRLNSYYGVGFNIVPFYAKMSLWGKRIMYFDMAITPTVGMTTYDQVLQTGNRQKQAFTYGVDVTQYFFFTNYFAIRADLKNQFYNADIARFKSSGGVATGSTVKSETAQDTLFMLGLTFFY